MRASAEARRCESHHLALLVLGWIGDVIDTIEDSIVLAPALFESRFQPSVQELLHSIIRPLSGLLIRFGILAVQVMRLQYGGRTSLI